ncbi:MAG: hypothetical protein MR694_07920, partial [Spirochaetia bacterium]|nr:hypothetical protein [Spirochaetia bacterium]
EKASDFYILGGFLVASTSLSNQKPGFPGFRRQSASIPPLRYGTGFASPSNPCHDQREWQGMRESALFNKRVFEENSQRLGNAQSPNPCHDQREWQGMRESAYVNKRVFEENSQRLGNAQSPNPLPRPKGVAR